ncbi:hypothetical protein DP129_05515 [Clostridium tetani]|uniref:hypothetical protein n=1 Tax=Clostridium tetani TaxID=1513 RepID=UPI00100BD342|nr:hypothetical protein [Clostridium tetani]RXI40165.1 hypothetical protein DP129_05515 [Clostridium tetani]
MKFAIFSFQEKHYKKITFACTVLITFFSILLYLYSLKTQDPNTNLISFVVSIVYALALFVLGLYLSAQGTRVENRFLAIKEHYSSLCRLQELFSCERLAKQTYNDIKSFIIFHQIFTARTENIDKPFINGGFFTYKSRYLKHEEAFLSTHSELLAKINRSVNDFIEQNSVSKKVPYPHIDKIEDFILNYNGWIEQHLHLAEPQMQLFSDFQSRFLKEQKVLIRKLKKETAYLISKNQGIGKTISDYRSKIEAIYGQKLHREIEREALINNSLSDINSLLQKIITQTSDIDLNGENILNSVSNINEAMSELSALISNQDSSVENIIDILSEETEY